MDHCNPFSRVFQRIHQSQPDALGKSKPSPHRGLIERPEKKNCHDSEIRQLCHNNAKFTH
jgi:hypothetical protein